MLDFKVQVWPKIKSISISSSVVAEQLCPIQCICNQSCNWAAECVN